MARRRPRSRLLAHGPVRGIRAFIPIILRRNHLLPKIACWFLRIGLGLSCLYFVLKRRVDGDSRPTDFVSGDSESNRLRYWIFSTVDFSLDKHIATSKRNTYPIEAQACRSLHVATCGSSAMERPSARLAGLVSMAMQRMPNPLLFSCALLTVCAQCTCTPPGHISELT